MRFGFSSSYLKVIFLVSLSYDLLLKHSWGLRGRTEHHGALQELRSSLGPEVKQPKMSRAALWIWARPGITTKLKLPRRTWGGNDYFRTREHLTRYVETLLGKPLFTGVASCPAVGCQCRRHFLLENHKAPMWHLEKLERLPWLQALTLVETLAFLLSGKAVSF